MEVACSWQYYELSEIPCYVHTMPGLLKVLETFVAYLIFEFLSHTSLYLHQPALEWCVATGMQPRDPCLPWRGKLGPGHTLR